MKWTPALSYIMAIDHIMLKVSDWKRAKEYYVAAFAPLGYELILDNPKIGGFAVQGSYNGRIYVAEGKQGTHRSVRPLSHPGHILCLLICVSSVMSDFQSHCIASA